VYKYSLLFNTVRTTTLILGLTRYGGPGRPHLPPPGGARVGNSKCLVRPAFYFLPRRARRLISPALHRASSAVSRFPAPATRSRPALRAGPIFGPVSNGYSEKLFQIEG